LRGNHTRINCDMFEVINWDMGSYYISCDVSRKKDKLNFKICVVYGAAYEEKKQEFLDELHGLLTKK
jgi:hypothetical protein